MATLLLELFSEEIPSRMQRGAAEQLQRLITTGFEKAGLAATDVKTFVSPRHLAIQLFGLPTIQPDVKEERKGPKVGAPEQAMKGFLGATGLTVEQCEQRDGYYFATIEKKGQPVATVAKQIIEDALNAFGWPKSMRWGNRPLQWVRPLHRIVALLDSEVIPAQFAHLTASNITEGHRFLAPQLITIPHAEKYVELLQAAKVVVDYAARKEQIRAEVQQIVAQQKLTLVDDEALLDEVTGLVEWPVPLLGTFDEKFLTLPPEVLISEMKTHQRYFALTKADGSLANQFITVANMVTNDGGKKVMEGNSRVVRARLSDGEFYWEQDKKTNLADWGKKLKDVVFHADVGKMNDKVLRIGIVALSVARGIAYSDETKIKKAALLCKADLTSGMVGEFPELQGIMGRYYAIAQDESSEVADAIRDHYKPLGLNDSVPESKLASIIAIADKVDSIVSMFGAGQIPTGSKDPFALRRAALGSLKIILNHKYDFSLSDAINIGLTAFVNTNFNYIKNEDVKILQGIAAKMSVESDDVIDAAVKSFLESIKTVDPSHGIDPYVSFLNDKSSEVHDFFRDRLKNLLREEGLRHDIIEACLTVDRTTVEKNFNPLAIATKARDLTGWLAAPKGSETFAAIKRVSNMLAAEEKKAKTTFAPAISASLKLDAEQQLAKALQAKTVSKPADLESLTAPINQFFTDVLVTEPEFRDARLSLLASVRATANSIADFSKLEG